MMGAIAGSTRGALELSTSVARQFRSDDCGAFCAIMMTTTDAVMHDAMVCRSSQRAATVRSTTVITYAVSVATLVITIVRSVVNAPVATAGAEASGCPSLKFRSARARRTHGVTYFTDKRVSAVQKLKGLAADIKTA